MAAYTGPNHSRTQIVGLSEDGNSALKQPIGSFHQAPVNHALDQRKAAPNAVVNDAATTPAYSNKNTI